MDLIFRFCTSYHVFLWRVFCINMTLCWYRLKGFYPKKTHKTVWWAPTILQGKKVFKQVWFLHNVLKKKKTKTESGSSQGKLIAFAGITKRAGRKTAFSESFPHTLEILCTFKTTTSKWNSPFLIEIAQYETVILPFLNNREATSLPWTQRLLCSTCKQL